MRTTFLVTYDISAVASKDLLAFLDTLSEIRNWFSPFLGSILVVTRSSENQSTLSTKIHDRFPGIQVCVCPIEVGGANGWMPPKYWDILRDKPDSGRWPPDPPSLMDTLLSGLGEPSTSKAPHLGLSFSDFLNKDKTKKP